MHDVYVSRLGSLEVTRPRPDIFSKKSSFDYEKTIPVP
jgi:hypothetical protein